MFLSRFVNESLGSPSFNTVWKDKDPAPFLPLAKGGGHNIQFDSALAVARAMGISGSVQ